MAVVALHIPNGGWAYDIAGEVTRENENAWLANVWELERWSRLISCPADAPTYARTNWTLIPFHGGAMVWTPAVNEQVYLRLEQYAAKVCGYLHVPYKRWGYATTPIPEQEEANWRAIEDWAGGIGACCSGSGEG
jgi:hypothetical protein